LIEVKNLTKTYKSGVFHKTYKSVVHDVSFSIKRGETLGIIGESGCGKTTLARMMLKLIKWDSGQVIVDGNDITALRGSKLRRFRIHIQIMFQNPESSLNPRMKIYDSIAEVLRINHIVPKKSGEERLLIDDLVNMVGLQKEHLNRYPWELSGGQVQRAVLARVMALKPGTLVLDEPTSMLDVSVQAQILSILQGMQKELNLTLIYIAHDLDIIGLMCDKILVMYQGGVIEYGTKDDIFEHRLHPYTKSLFDEFYMLNRDPDFGHYDQAVHAAPQKGCKYLSACTDANEKCSETQTLRETTPGHYVACWNA
jgi:oligopeptide/dipeptide ABC transporter ATP-binding protein